jgi:hypothetical protein
MAGESYKEEIVIPLTDSFFNEPGDYSIVLKYGQFVGDVIWDNAPLFKGVIYSNKIDFIGNKCGEAELKEATRVCKKK